MLLLFYQNKGSVRPLRTPLDPARNFINLLKKCYLGVFLSSIGQGFQNTTPSNVKKKFLKSVDIEGRENPRFDDCLVLCQCSLLVLKLLDLRDVSS